MSRLTVLLGRLGAVFIAVGMALTLVSFIPPATMGSEYASINYVNKKTFAVGYSWVLNPQQVLTFAASANSTVSLYLVDKRSDYIYEWVSQDDDHLSYDAARNVSLFDSFLTAHPDSVLVEEEVGLSEKSFEYAPTKVVNVTMVAANRGSNDAVVTYRSTLSTVVGPKRVILFAQVLVPVGAVLVFPWLVAVWREKTQPRQKLEK